MFNEENSISLPGLQESDLIVDFILTVEKVFIL